MTVPSTSADTDFRLYLAQREYQSAQSALRRAQEAIVAAEARADDARAKRDAADPVIRAHHVMTNMYDQMQKLAPPAADTTAINIDADQRNPQTQAQEFFNRPGDYHQVQLEIPLDDNDMGQKLAAPFVVKFTPEQRDLVVEVLRQLRGALNARITITRLETVASNPCAKPEPPQVKPVEVSCVKGADNIPADGPAYQLGRDITVGPRTGERERIAALYGVPVDWVIPAHSPTGDTAWTITPEPQQPPGRHAAPEPSPVYNEFHSGHVEGAAPADSDRPYQLDDIYRAHHQHRECSILSTTRTHELGGDTSTVYRCGCGQQVAIDTTEEHANQLWSAHRREQFEAALLGVHDHVDTGDNE